ncbi:MAG: protein kinase [Syntrophobacterales bacterium]|jgi:serine/threonine-protein kinase
MKKIGKYEICGLLGKGAMSVVYKVRFPRFDKIAALKLLSPHPHLVGSLGMEEIKKRFVAEAKTMASLRHPNIVSIWDFDEDEGRPFLVMEYYCNSLGLIIGETYQIEDPSRALTLDKTVHYLRQILAGLRRLHQAGIIHRDIKPFNILVTDEDTVKISDFAFSKLRGEVWKPPPNVMVGSPCYAAPEQEQEPDGVDVKADIYSVGVMLHRMLTGKFPVGARIRASEFHPDVTEEWDSFLTRAVAPERRDRFASSGEMLQALEQLAADWQERKEQICSVASPRLATNKNRPDSTRILRAQPIKVRPRQARQEFQLDQLWRPRHYVDNDFKEHGDTTVTDRVTGLLWQQDGSDFPMTWKEAQAYVQQLNSERFAGRSNWRLPTVTELCSLLIETGDTAALCIEPLFSQEKRWLWSADRRSFVAAWYVSVDMGFVSWQDFSCYFFVRAVCSDSF